MSPGCRVFVLPHVAGIARCTSLRFTAGAYTASALRMDAAFAWNTSAYQVAFALLKRRFAGSSTSFPQKQMRAHRPHLNKAQ
jgi:hypothetical protein